MDEKLQDLTDKIIKYAEKSEVQYCDARAEHQLKKSILIENGEIEHIRNLEDKGIGVRLIKNGAWSFCSITNPNSFNDIKEILDKTIKNSDYTQSNKKNKIVLHNNSINKKQINFKVLKKPEIDELIKIGLECNKIIMNTKKIIKSVTNPYYTINSKYFTNTEGSEILQNFTDVIIEMVATAHDSGQTQSINITEGGRGGLELITNKAQQSAKEIAKKSSELLSAKPIKQETSTVVMNPDFVSLLTHEILGHPSEADRVLGKEMAWAGGAWWKGKIGQKIGSENLNVFDDPTIKESLGWYYFDDEGVETKKTSLIEKGILKNHMQNRETSEIFNTIPTGNMRATNYRYMPLIRMACTCIANGDQKVDEIIKDVKNGYYISNMKVPSIDMKRYNWSISCQYAQKIENGELRDLHRDVIVMGTAPEFFNSIDACGNDFTVRPITNCGKGDPMQSMIMGNGGPTIRGTATVKSVN
ncbi:MAG: TldD/PmbA family protein [Candidatus Nitrosopumilus limneticus]|nr:C part of proposed TldE/TldD proteolytic complex [Candidatus Nitrosopumilus limneticus]MDC4212352.1 TldD/PmbA family protein [Candidatus Nitrosopumilus limneticus]MDC4213467.1 TldD/PmbA family protein [Candidatus Nitrosopumilus limneticus]MDC4214865.1 TldD/PmbA family protein [Candidatus Nitrosopumilus limneticus]MDC4215736.1 TldD/PmbA family protein [Candidatus Nitrosopumilus limneticus]